MERDKEATKQKLINALGEIIIEKGFTKLGINSVAQKAGVDKVLIYRYFGDLDGLIMAYITQKDFISHLDEMFGKEINLQTGEHFKALARKLFINQLYEIKDNKELQQILIWELCQKNDITDKLASNREQQGMQMLNQINRHIDFNKFDLPAISSLLIGGIYYLVLRSRIVDVYSGIPLNTDIGWKRIEDAILLLIDLVADKTFKQN